MVVLGLDSGLARFGLAALRLEPDGSSAIVALDVFSSAPSTRKTHTLAGDDLARRARELASWLAIHLRRHQPAALCVESPSWPRNAGAAAKMGTAFGVLFALADEHDLPLLQASPQAVKRAATGAKTASKDDVVGAMRALYPEASWPRQTGLHEHAADAIAVVIACQDSEVLRMARRLSA